MPGGNPYHDAKGEFTSGGGGASTPAAADNTGIRPGQPAPRGPGAGGVRNERDEGVHALRAVGKTHAEIAATHGISSARVHQILRDYKPEGGGSNTVSTVTPEHLSQSGTPHTSAPVLPVSTGGQATAPPVPKVSAAPPSQVTAAQSPMTRSGSGDKVILPSGNYLQREAAVKDAWKNGKSLGNVQAVSRPDWQGVSRTHYEGTLHDGTPISLSLRTTGSYQLAGRLRMPGGTRQGVVVTMHEPGYSAGSTVPTVLYTKAHLGEGSATNSAYAASKANAEARVAKVFNITGPIRWSH